MDKMYTLKPDESINDHVKDTKDIINHIVELSIGCMRDLANPHEGTFVDMTYNDFMHAIEHVRNSIEMLDELCDELEEDKDGIRQEYEEKVIQFFNRFMNSDLTDEQERTRSNQLGKELSDKSETIEIVEMLRTLIHKLDIRPVWKSSHIDDVRPSSTAFVLSKAIHAIEYLDGELEDTVEDWTKHCEALHQTYREKLAAKDREIESLTQQLIDSSPNNPQNFCGNCKHFVTHPNDIGTCNNKWAKPFIVDPDDASCPHFESNQVDRDKPDHPCCEACNRDDCDDCTLCPF